jgi:hypothetical protein
VEGQEHCVGRYDGSEMIVSLVQPPKNVEDEVAIRDSAVEIGQVVDHALHLATEVTH